ncbi:unnamed protein product (macronuclear) [Paramecium tetraurelia]|uniref:RING-type domain-containing protein n=1 Tax=Paramecium tetraurelia TaxID=5888 RepID=A0CKL4_PARTE|nr:uncharacterized protein GSPATT00001045001 [Paramecium tetraurelia]CAK71331.1 unnamed protein product [Paramecium tetraurelia]|eukprot:XP_001438728.1 hypothetical protein (macronuclear) [Paramecium tetraurelia strain d4-2]
MLCKLVFLSNEINLSTSKEISNYYQIYQYDESLYIGFQSTYEANIIVRIQQIISNQCILECQNETECKNQFCNCNFYQVGQDCNLIIDDLTSQQIFQGKKIYYVDVQKGQNESQSVLLEFQNSTTFYGFCITQNFNPNLITQQNNKTLYISLDQINQCYEQVNNFREQFNSSINYYFLIYFDTNNHTYLESAIQNTDNNQLIIILSTILSSISFCFLFCLIKSKCFKKQKEPEKENQKYELKHAPSLIDQFFPSQEFAALRNKCEKLVTLNQCLICLDLFYDDSRVRVTYCNHIFHTSCFDKWMNVHKSCPNCRSLFDEESILKYSNQKEAEIFQWSSRTEEVKTTMKPLINETQQQQPQVSQLDSQRNIQAF